MAEPFSAIGAPARIAGRVPLVARYISGGFFTLRGSSSYATARFGKSYRWRPWLPLDIKDLETLEELINTGSDMQIAAFRTSQLSVCGMIAIIVSQPQPRVAVLGRNRKKRGGVAEKAVLIRLFFYG